VTGKGLAGEELSWGGWKEGMVESCVFGGKPKVVAFGVD